jgi:hypothetical protein
MGVIDLNANGDFADDLLRGNVISSISLGVGLAKNMLLLSSGTFAIGSFIGSGALQTSGAAVGEIRFNRGTRAKRRIAWREIIRD